MTRPMSHGLIPLGLIGLFPLAFVLVAGSTVGQPDPCACDGPPRCYVLVGIEDDDSWYNKRVANNSADEAASDFADAGCQVVRKNRATGQDVVDALNDPCARGLWIMAHGIYNTTKGVLGKEKASEPFEMINMGGDVITGDPTYGFGIVLPPNPCIKSVTLHSCGQDLPSWRRLFSNATVNAWDSPVTGPTIYWWQWFHWEDPFIITTRATTQTGALGPPSLHASLEPEGHVLRHPIGPRGEMFSPDMGRVPDAWTLRADLAQEIGDQSFEFYAWSDADDEDVRLLYSGDIVEGRLVDWDYTEARDPDFAVAIRNRALFAILEEPSHVWTAWENGDVLLETAEERHEASKAILFQAFARIAFGQEPSGVAPAVPDGPTTSPTREPEPVQVPAPPFALVVAALLIGAARWRRRA